MAMRFFSPTLKWCDTRSNLVRHAYGGQPGGDFRPLTQPSFPTDRGTFCPQGEGA